MLRMNDIDSVIALFRSILNGDEKAFKKFFIKFYPILCSYANQFVDLDKSKDIVQDVMIWIWENRENINVESSPISYLLTAIRNNCLKYLKRDMLKYDILEKLYEDSDSPYDNPDFYILEELTAKLNEALEKLPENYRVAFVKNRFDNKTYKEIADELNVSSKTVDYRIQQALKILRVELKDYLPLLIAIL